MVIIIIDVNVEELNNSVLELSSLIDEYEEIKLNLFNELKDSCLNWQDDNSLKFDSEIYLDKEESDFFIASLKAKKNFFDLVYTKYIEIGKKIKVNLDNKTSLLNSFDVCINEADSIINSYRSIDRSFYYSEINAINSQIEMIRTIKNKLAELKTSATSLLKKIGDIEIELGSQIAKFENIKINDFNFNLGGTNE